MKKARYWIAIGVVFAAFVSIFLFSVYGLPSIANGTWDIVAALGTVAAVIVALGISLKDHFSKRREENIKAALAAARIYYPLASIAGQLRPIRDWLLEVKYVDPGPALSLQNIRRMQAIRFSFDAATLLALAPLRNRCAYKLAAALGHFEAAQNALPALKHLFEQVDARDRRIEIANFLATQLSECVVLLEKVVAECEKVSIVLNSPHD